jgi:phosphoribosylformimino-5-aminoimidazole carboxamide ribotide isomerase
MDIIPAIDLKNGKCVRLRQGEDSATTEYSTDPVAVARGWFHDGARRLHLVNLDGAFGRVSDHLELLRRIAALSPYPVQYGGGLRSLEAVRSALDAGASKVVLGTVAVEDPSLFRQMVDLSGPERCIVAVDAKGGKIATRGWTDVTAIDVVEFVIQLRARGIREVLYTDVARDGMMSGTDTTTLLRIAETGMGVIASGGIASEDDVRALFALKNNAITGVIIGKALYERRVTLPSLLALATEFQRRS